MELELGLFTLAQQAYFYVCAAILGAVFGSFTNCLAWRCVHGENVLRGRSHCATCNHQLGVLDLIPIFSWLFLRGKCRYCGQKVSPRYFAVEVLMAAVFVLLLYRFNLGISWVALCGLCCVLLALALVDLDTFTIPNGFIIAAVVFWVLYLVGEYLAGRDVASTALWGLVAAFAFGAGMLLVSLAFDRITGKQSLGGGDIKLLFAVGLFLGPAQSLFNLILSCVVGLVMSFALPKKTAEPAQEGVDEGEDAQPAPIKAFPFGPAISFSTFITLMVGAAVVNWYASLFL